MSEDGDRDQAQDFDCQDPGEARVQQLQHCWSSAQRGGWGGGAGRIKVIFQRHGNSKQTNIRGREKVHFGVVTQ